MNTSQEKRSILDSDGVRTGLKVALLSLSVLLLLIPLQMVRSIVDERATRSAEIAEETILTHGGRQLITGPVLQVPVTVTTVPGIPNDTGADAAAGADPGAPTVSPEAASRSEMRVTRRTEWISLPMSDIVVELAVDPLVLQRGIYDIPVYAAALTIRGTMDVPAEIPLEFEGTPEYRWEESVLVMGLSGLSGLKQSPSVAWDGRQAPVTSATRDVGGVHSGVSAGVDGVEPASSHRFQIDLDLGGGGSLRVLPMAMRSDVRMVSGWPSPSFSGAILPTERTLTDSGFQARWQTTGLGMGIPAAWKEGSQTYRHAGAFGVDLYTPVDLYQKSLRSVKYGALFLLLPFAALFLAEFFGGARIHPVQYVLVGAAKVVFYLLLLSLAEHTSFLAAYLVGAAATVVLITLYAMALFPRPRYAAILAGLLTAEYLFLYAALASQDYALLIGSVGLFAVLAAVMLATRKVDWYRPARKPAGADA